MIKRPTPAATSAAKVFQLDTLEKRVLLAATPSTPRAITVLDTVDRQELLDAMPNMPQSRHDLLQRRLDDNKMGAFDFYLQEWIQYRGTAAFFFDDPDTAGIASFLNDSGNNISVSNDFAAADAVVDDRMFPEIENKDEHTVQLGSSIDWNAEPSGVHDDFLHTLNRFVWWPSQTTASVLSADDAYVEDLDYQLASWHEQYATGAEPSFWAESDQDAWFLDSAIRADYWVWSYFKLLGSDYMATNVPSFSTLMLLKVGQAGDYLFDVAQEALASEDAGDNRTLTVAKTLHEIGQMFPEFVDAAAWEAAGRELAFKSMDGQFYADGSHVEQSPGYAQVSAESLLDMYVLDDRNGDLAEWNAGNRAQILENAVAAYNQFVTPDGKRPAIGDTYRTTSVTLYFTAAAALDKLTSNTTTITSITGNAGTQTSFQVADGSIFSAGDHVMELDKSEVMRVTGVSGNTLSVERYFAGVSTLNGLANGETLVNFGDIPLAKPRTRDVWMFGPGEVSPFTQFPALGVVGARGQTTALPDSGNYIFRNEDESTQLTFDAGPKGGTHGHFDLLNFELFADDRALIADPGPYQYDGSDDRLRAIGTNAHNTINVGGFNHGELEASQRSNIDVYQYDDTASTVHVSASHNAYAYLPGSPAVARSVWYDKDDTYLVVDWARSSTSYDFNVNFTMPYPTGADLTGWATDGNTQYARSRFADGPNVILTSLDRPGQSRTTATNGNVFVTDLDDPDYKGDARRYGLHQTGTDATFVTMMRTYDGAAVGDVTFETIGTVGTTGAFQVRVIRNGSPAEVVTFTPPDLDLPGTDFDRNGTHNDLQFDANGVLHFAYYDRGADSGSTGLKYTTRDPITGEWSPVSVIDDSTEFAGQYVDLVLDNLDRPAIAYFDGTAGDLKYAYLNPAQNSWQVETVDAKKSVGLYPSLTFSGSNAPLIAYYHGSNKELRVAAKQGVDQWDIAALDGFQANTDRGRFSQIRLDPNRTDLNSRYVVAYEDTWGATYKYGHFYAGNFTTEIIDPNMQIAGGYLSLDFVDSGTGTDDNVFGDKYQPVVSYYASVPDTALKYAYRTKNAIGQPGTWNSYHLDANGPGKRAGLYSKLNVRNNRPDIFYFDFNNNLLKRATMQSNGTWAYEVLPDAGGREVSVDYYGAAFAYTTLDEPGGGRLTVKIV